MSRIFWGIVAVQTEDHSVWSSANNTVVVGGLQSSRMILISLWVHCVLIAILIWLVDTGFVL